jgi:putative membrane protein
MLVLANVLIALVALLHLYFLVLEMFLWTTPFGRKAFGLKEVFALESRALAANQGLYNGFLAAGLVWGLLLGADGFPEKVFFLSCVIVAGVFGGATVSKKIVIVQAVPAVIALALVYLSR